jgi:hypothetical protein
VVNLPGLPKGGDSFDWFGQGHSVDDLWEIIFTGDVWSPEAVEQQRRDRRRALTRERVRRFRARNAVNVEGER